MANLIPEFSAQTNPMVPLAPQNTPQKKRPVQSSKGKRKNVFLSYSLDADYLERKFVSELFYSLEIEYGLENELWFDLKENCLATSNWMAIRLENAERCKAAIVILSNSYLDNRQGLNELKTLLERSRENPKSVRIYLILYESAQLSSAISEHITIKVDLNEYAMKNVSEKVFICTGSVGRHLEKRYAKKDFSDKATVTAESNPNVNEENNSLFRAKSLIHWSVSDVQNWLKSKGVPNFHRDAFLERQIDGFLLEVLGESQLTEYLLIDNKHVVRKIPEMVADRLKNDLQKEESWHYRYRDAKEKPSTIYLIFDPKDIATAYNVQKYFRSRGFTVMFHEKLGSSREEFLKENAPIMGQCANFLVIISQSGSTSPFVYNETVFVEWMGRNVCSILMKDSDGGAQMRAGLRAILQDKPAATLDVENFNDDMLIVEYLIAPAKPIPSNVVLQQEYVYMLTENIKFLADFMHDTLGDLNSTFPSVYISYHWDIQVQVYKLSELLQYYGIPSWADFSSAATPQRSKPPSGNMSAVTSSGAGGGGGFETAKLDTLQNQIMRNIRNCTAVLCCFSEQYSHSDNCYKDMYTAMTLGKPILPLLLTNVKFPPEAPVEVKSVMEKYVDRVLDMSTGRLLQQNLPKLVHSVRKLKGITASMEQ